MTIVEYILYERDEEGYNGEWLDSVDRAYSKITPRTIKQNSLVLLKNCNCKPGMYNIDLIRGPKGVVQDSEFYEYCAGYADIKYDGKQVEVVEMKINKETPKELFNRVVKDATTISMKMR